LACYDGAIHFLDRDILLMRYLRHVKLRQTIDKRQEIDEKRRLLRLKMKGY
jgi:hypothetical protein